MQNRRVSISFANMASKKASTKDFWTAEQILDFWEDPKNREHIVNAKPLEDYERMEKGDKKPVAPIAAEGPITSAPTTELERLELKDQDSALQASSTPKERPKKQEKALFGMEETDTPHVGNTKQEQENTYYDETGNMYESQLHSEVFPQEIFVKTDRPHAKKYSTSSQLVDRFKKMGNTSKHDQHVPPDSKPHSPATSSLFSSDPTDSKFIKVTESDLTTFPFQSVGKIFWFQPGYKYAMYYATAFYIDDEKIMTAAHTFDRDDTPPHEAVFIPAMINKYDISGSLYGHYAVIAEELRIHTNYKKFTADMARPDDSIPPDESVIPYYDICTIKIGRGRKRENNIERSISIVSQCDDSMEEQEDACLRPIKIYPFKKNKNKKHMERCIVLGYGMEQNELFPNKNNDVKMMKYQGTLCETKCPGLIAMDEVIWEGASGGPWFIDYDSIAYGIQSAVAFDIDKCKSFSPLFTKAMLSEVEATSD